MLSETKTGNDHKPVRVLMIDGDPVAAQNLIALFGTQRSEDFTLFTEEHLTGALRILETEPVDVAIVDLFLKDSTGMNTLSRITDASPETAVVVLTDLHNTAVARSALKQGAQDYLTKGDVDGPDLFRAIRFARDCKELSHQRRRVKRRLDEVSFPRNAGSLHDEIAQNSAQAIACWNQFQNKTAESIWDPTKFLRIVFQIC